jgi:DNA-directed RNA polymerase subunit M/transcription elongation factor TFIIS
MAEITIIDTITIDEIRDIGSQTLGSILKNPSNIKTLEKYIYNTVQDNEDDIEIFQNEYKRNLYQVVGDILSGTKLATILSTIKEEKIGWKHPCFENISNRINEQNEFIVNPFNVEEGVLKCHKCGSKRVFSYNKMTRSSDESTSTFAQCIACKAKWVNS